MVRPTKPSTTQFGISLGHYLSENQTTGTTLANSMGISNSYVTQVMHGTKSPSPQWIDLVAKSLSLSAEETVQLHRAAAVDKGFRLDLPSDYRKRHNR